MPPPESLDRLARLHIEGHLAEICVADDVHLVAPVMDPGIAPLNCLPSQRAATMHEVVLGTMEAFGEDMREGPHATAERLLTHLLYVPGLFCLLGMQRVEQAGN